MKKFLKRNAAHIALALAFGVFVLVSWLVPLPAGKEAASRFADFFLEFATFVPLLFVLVGLFDVWFPRSVIERHLGPGSGAKGIFWVTLLAMLQAGPLYGAFPMAGVLWKKGASPRNIFIYLGAFATLKIPMLTFESGFLGLKFTLLRTLFTVPLFIVVGFLMEFLVGKRGFKVTPPGEGGTTDNTDG